MPPLLENLLVSILTGIIASGTLVLSLSSNQERDWIIIATTGLVSFSGSFINGLRQLHMDNPR